MRKKRGWISILKKILTKIEGEKNGLLGTPTKKKFSYKKNNERHHFIITTTIIDTRVLFFSSHTFIRFCRRR